MKTAILMTCHNRCQMTKACIESIAQKRGDISIYIADAGSTDGTIDMLQEMKNVYDIHFWSVGEDVYYSQGMRYVMQKVLEGEETYDYVLLVNDDVCFYESFLDAMIRDSMKADGAVVVGTVCDPNGNTVYGGIRYRKGIKYEIVSLEDQDRSCHTFNANCVLIPGKIFEQVGEMDSHYVHALGDFDYGMRIRKAGYSICATSYYIGSCVRNEVRNTWRDTKLSRKERFQRKESVKEAPFGPWYFYLKTHFGFFRAVFHSMTPYIRILIGR